MSWTSITCSIMSWTSITCPIMSWTSITCPIMHYIIFKTCDLCLGRCLFRYVGSVMFLSFRTDRSGQTVQTQIRLLLDQSLHCLQFLCIFWMHYSKETPSCSTFRMITGVRNFTVLNHRNKHDTNLPAPQPHTLT